MSRRDLSHRTVRLGYEGVGESTIESLETVAGRLPKAHTLEALAAALDVPPETFYEYPIAAAQRDAKSGARADEIDEAVAASRAFRRGRESGST